ncbi:MAG: pilus assembly protein PilP [Methylococcaceae bacterium]
MSISIIAVTRNILSGLASLGLSLCLVGCSQPDFSDLQKYIADIKAKPKLPIKPLPEIKVVDPFLFNGENVRDPFAAVVENAQEDMADKFAGSGIKPDPLHQKEDLEHYPLDALKMVGTMNVNSALWGLIKVNADASAKDGGLGTVYRVKVGDYMGSNYGKILRIAPDKIELMEIVPDKPGTWREQEQELPLVLAE